MTALQYDRQDELIKWASDRIGFDFRADAVAVGFLNSQLQLTAVVVYDNFSPCDCNMHIASDGTRRWLTRGVLRGAFAYPFVQLQLNRVTGLVPSKNKAALRLDLKLGFEIEGKCQEALPTDDIYIMGMLRRNCPFIPQEYRND